MGVTFILVISILIQFAAAFLALRLIRITGKRTAWILIAAAIFLMAIRRLDTLIEAVSRGALNVTTMQAELIALAISVVMLIGVIQIAPLFLSLKRSEETLRKAYDELEMRNAQLKAENEMRLRTEESLKSEEARLEALLRLNQMSEASVEEMAGFTLERGIALTSSKIGFVGFLDEDEAVYTLHAVSKDVVKECNVEGNPLHWPVADAGIWADTIRERRTLFINDYSKPHPSKKGLPPGHPPVSRLMVVPVFDGKRIVAIAGVGNKASDYDKSDERQIALLLGGLWNNVQRNLSRKALEEARDQLEQRVKQRTMELEEAYQDLNRAQAVAYTGSWRLDVQRNQLLWSDESHRMFGIPRGTPMTYETFLSCVHPEDREYVDNKWKAALKGEVYDIEHRVIVGDIVKWVRERAELEFDSEGELKGGFGTVQDITKRKQMEEKLAASELRYRRLFETAQDGVLILDADTGIINDINPFLINMLGYSKEDFLGKKLWEIGPIKDARASRSAFHTLKESGYIRHEDLPLETKSGKLIEVEFISNVYEVNHNKVIQCNIRDITERKRIENELRIKDFAVTSAVSGIAITDLEGYVTYLNLASISMWDYKEEEVLGKHATFFFADKNEASVGLKAVLEEGAWQGELKAKRRDGSIFDVQVLANLVTDADGEPFCSMASFVDITERKRLDQLKDEFIGLVSHELRTPLTVIGGCLSTLLTDWNRLSQSEVQQLLEDALLESESLSHLIENLLELSRAQAQQLSLYSEPTNVKTLVKEALSKIKRQAPSHRFVTSIPSEPMLIHADPLRIERILYNLLDNAAKYSPPGSQIKVSVNAEPERLVIGVSDRGKGLSSSEQARIFGPFQRLENTRPDQARGAGLGLMVCRRLVEAHGGEIWVESKKGRGSTFFFSLPRRNGTDAGRVSLETAN